MVTAVREKLRKFGKWSGISYTKKARGFHNFEANILSFDYFSSLKPTAL